MHDCTVRLRLNSSIYRRDWPTVHINTDVHARTHTQFKSSLLFFLSLPIFLWLLTSSSSLHKLIVISIQNIPISIQSVIIFFLSERHEHEQQQTRLCSHMVTVRVVEHWVWNDGTRRESARAHSQTKRKKHKHSQRHTSEWKQLGEKWWLRLLRRRQTHDEQHRRTVALSIN